MMSKFIYVNCILFVVVSGVAWSQNSAEPSAYDSFFISEDLLYPSELTLVKDWLFVKDILEGTGDYGLKVFDINTANKEYEFISPGRGPGEYLSFDIQKGPGENLLEITDSQNKRSDIYNVDCLKRKPPVSETHTCIVQSVANRAGIEAVILNDSLVFNVGGAMINGVLSVNNGARIVHELDSIPQDLIQKYKNPRVAVMTMGGYLVANTDRSRIAYFAQHYDTFTLFEVSPDVSIATLMTKKHSYLPEFDVTEAGGSFYLEPSPEGRFAFRAPASSNTHIFVPFSGKTEGDIEVSEDIEWRAFTKRIKVFNWEGKQVNEIMLDYQVSTIEVDLNEKMLFGVHFTKDMNAYIIKHMLVK